MSGEILSEIKWEISNTNAKIDISKLNQSTLIKKEIKIGKFVKKGAEIFQIKIEAALLIIN